MTPELLKLCTVLQPLFLERRGEWQPGDSCYDSISKKRGYVTEVSPNRVWINFDGVPRYTHVDNPDLLFLPRTIDDSSPEAQKRSLLGMMSGLVSVENKGKGRGYYVWVESGEVMQHFDGATSTEAILRALVAQEGVEG